MLNSSHLTVFNHFILWIKKNWSPLRPVIGSWSEGTQPQSEDCKFIESETKTTQTRLSKQRWCRKQFRNTNNQTHAKSHNPFNNTQHKTSNSCNNNNDCETFIFVHSFSLSFDTSIFPIELASSNFQLTQNNSKQRRRIRQCHCYAGD